MKTRAFLKFFAVVVLLALLAGCGGTAGSNQPVDVQVTATDFAFQSSLTTFKVGVPYHFVVVNKGKVPHEFMIVKPIPAGQMDMEQMDNLALAHIEADDLQPGQTATVDYTFKQAYPEGTMEFACHLPGHYEAGMKLPIIVK